MMEVKQNTAVDLSDLLTSSKNSGTDEVDDAVMQDLSDATAAGLINCDIMEANDKSPVIEDIRNGDTDMSSLIKDIDEEVGEDLGMPVNSELEDALLAEDETLPDITNNKSVEPTLTAADDILAEKSEASNSTTSSSNVRDPGDDLDTLLSKINDIVEDCIEKENENHADTTMELNQTLHQKESIQNEEKLIQNVLEVEEKNKTIDTDLSQVEKPEILAADGANGGDENLNNSEETANLLIDSLVAPNLGFTLPSSELAKNTEEELNDEKDKTDIEENETSLAVLADSNEKNTTESETTLNNTENSTHLEKTEKTTDEVVQDNKITSNSNEVAENIETPQPTIDVDDGNQSNLNADAESSGVSINAKDADEEILEQTSTPTQNDDKTSKKEEVVLGNAENEDSDDEIVFYVDKPPEQKKSEKPANKSPDLEDEADKSKKEEVEKKMSEDDDDIVLLLDDDEEDINQDQDKKDPQNDIESYEQNQNKQSESSSISTSENASTKEKDIVVDNSDNARDDFAFDNPTEKVKSDGKNEDAETPEETNSNCSSSSNLLQESKSIKTAADENIAEDAENEEEEDDGDVELIIGDLKEPEPDKVDDSAAAPPAKRIRLSEDGDQEDTKKPESCDRSDEVESLNDNGKKEESLDDSEQEKNSSSTLSTLKRSHDVIELEADEKSNDSNERCNKKPKTDLPCEKLDITLDDKPSEDVQILNEDKKEIKAVPSYEPIRLYPAPKLEALKSEQPMSLEYLKKFRKSFDNMTKQDLEELVLQKVVEAIIHKSEFSEMRELIEKQEKLISAHRTKISELSKQFRDLEMVHNRVVKDIEQRNSQFIMPVKITRAVGLQVYIPNKKSIAETTSSSISQSIPTSPQRPVSSQASTSSNTSITPPQRQFLPSQTTDIQPQRLAVPSSSVSNNASNMRRGCTQKITPIRPVPGIGQSTSSGSSAAPASAPYRNTQSHVAAAQPRILNKNAATNQNVTPLQRSRYVGPTPDSQRMPTQQISRPPNMPPNNPRAVNNITTQSKSSSSVATPVQRRSEPLPAQAANNSATTSIVDNYLNSLTHLTGSNTAVSITPAKPKEKAVIDLTDEDETPIQSTGIQAVTQIPGAQQLQRRSLPGPNNSSSQLQHGRAPPTLARVPPASQMANNKNRQMSSIQQAQKSNSFTSISTPPGTSITRINVAANNSGVQRMKYSHPAPLPATPPQAFNPTWKLPPPRPTIRISNLDNGIVISWTMEESMDRHAECVSYQIYAYQETSGPPMVDSWRHVGDVKAMLLPMAVTLTQFQEGQRYYFAVRAVDCHQRYGPFSLPKTWS